MLLGVAGVVPSRHEEGVHMRLARADRFLLHAADRADGAVEVDLARRRDPVPVVDVPSELLHHLEREREPGRGAADIARIDRDLDRQMDVERRFEKHADDGPARAPPSAATVLIGITRLCLPRRTVKWTESPTALFTLRGEDVTSARGLERR